MDIPKDKTIIRHYDNSGGFTGTSEYEHGEQKSVWVQYAYIKCDTCNRGWDETDDDVVHFAKVVKNRKDRAKREEKYRLPPLPVFIGLIAVVMFYGPSLWNGTTEAIISTTVALGIIFLWLTLPGRDPNTWAGSVIKNRWVKLFLAVTGSVLFTIFLRE